MKLSKDAVLICILCLIAVSIFNTLIIFEKKGITGRSTGTAQISFSIINDTMTSCGDGVCTGGENCESCSADCGTCPPATVVSGGGGGGGSSSKTCSVDWDCKDWGECSPAGIKTRQCFNIGTCAGIISREEEQNCVPEEIIEEEEEVEEEKPSFVPYDERIFYVDIKMEGVSKLVSLNMDQYIDFPLNGFAYYLSVEDVEYSSVDVSIYPAEAEATLKPGVTYTIDLDGDTSPDVFMMLDDIRDSGSVYIELRDVPKDEADKIQDESVFVKQKPLASPMFLVTWVLIFVIVGNVIWLASQVKGHAAPKKVKKKR